MVNANFARTLLKNNDIVVVFFEKGFINDTELLSKCVHLNSHDPLKNIPLKEIRVGKLWNDRKVAKRSICFYPNMRYGMGRFFGVETQMVHDMTPLLFPEFHIKDTVKAHKRSYRKELAISDFIVCNSNATRNDLLKYYPNYHDKSFVSYLGPMNCNLNKEKLSHLFFDNIEPYLLMVGTLEPRKNHNLVFQMLFNHLEIIDKYKIVIVGRNGWGSRVNELNLFMSKLNQHHQSRILHLDYVTENEKAVLFQNAAMSLYPSLYEGFGLPVIESLQFGVPVVASNCSSLPEVGGSVAEYCDPNNADSLYQAIRRIEIRLNEDGAKYKQRCREQSEKFSWKAFTNTIINESISLLESRI
ncbi:MAG: glycosyltransferase family 4 protein [Desulfobacterales bacterium]|nr:glycosyltransferase family 4 protein [Desulfobacterales bacterium]